MKERLDCDIKKNEDTSSFIVYFHTAIETRYLKVSSIWDDRDVHNISNLVYATFKNTISDLIQVWTMTTRITSIFFRTYGDRVNLVLCAEDTHEFFVDKKVFFPRFVEFQDAELLQLVEIA